MADQYITIFGDAIPRNVGVNRRQQIIRAFENAIRNNGFNRLPVEKQLKILLGSVGGGSIGIYEGVKTALGAVSRQFAMSGRGEKRKDEGNPQENKRLRSEEIGNDGAIVPFDGDGEADSFGLMGARTVAGGTTGGAFRETPITEAPHIDSLEKTPTRTVRIPLNFNVTACQITSQTPAMVNKIRTNSLYVINANPSIPIVGVPDTWTATTKVDNGTGYRLGGSFTTDGGGLLKPHYLGCMEDIYSKYTVLGMKYKIKFRVHKDGRGNAFKVAMALTSATVPAVVGWDTAGQWDIWEHADVIRGPTTENQYGGSEVVWDGYIKTGDTFEEIFNDSSVSTWTDVGSAPSLPQYMNIYIMNAQGVQAATPLKADVTIYYELEFIVQFKGLLDKWRMPTNANNPVFFAGNPA